MLVLRATVLVTALSAILLLANWGEPYRAWAAQGEPEGESGESPKVTLRIEGEEGVPFSGFCTVGEKRHDLAGDAPRSYEYDPGDEDLACEVRKEGSQGGGLEVVLSGENTRSEQRLEGKEGTVRMTYGGGGTATSMSSSQTAGVAVSSTSSGANDKGPDTKTKELAGEIKQMVAGILERNRP